MTIVLHSRRSHRTDIARAVPHLLFLLFAALLVYQPWASVPFPMVDYSEFLQHLQSGTSVSDGLGNVIAYYQSHGRSSYLAYLQLGIDWVLFREHPVGWNFAVFAYMAAAVAGVWFLLVRLGNRPIVATIAAALCIVSTPVVDVWLRPTGEPLVLLFTTLALIIALSYQQSDRWRPRAVTLLLLFLGIGLAKDLLTPLLFVPFVVALCWNDGIRMPRVTRRNVWLAAGTLVVAATLAFSIWHALSHRGPNAYTEGYSRGNVSPLQSIGIFWTALLPYTRSMTNQRIGAAHVVANALFLGMLVVGWRFTLRGPRRSAALVELNLWLALLLFGAVLYSPLGWFSPFYALPFALGSVALFARALSAFDVRALLRWLARGVAVFILLAGAATAASTARREIANRRIHGQLAGAIGAVAGVDSIVVAWPTLNSWQWAQQASVIRRYAITRGDMPENAPPAHDALCGVVKPGGGSLGRILLINYPDRCPDLQFAASELTEPYLTFNPLPRWQMLRLQVAVVGPDSASAPPLHPKNPPPSQP